MTRAAAPKKWLLEPALTLGPVGVYLGDVREVLSQLPDEAVQVVVTSPPYWGLRDYGTVGQLGLEATPDEYVANMVAVFREVRRVLRKDGTLWLNLGDSYASNGGTGDTTSGFNERWSDGAWSRQGKQGDTHAQRPMRARGQLKPKDLIGIPWRVAFALQADGWYLRSDIIWSKPNPMPESVTDRPTKAHEYLFLLTKSPRYFYNADAIREAALEASYNTERVTSGQSKRDALGEMARTTPVGRTCGVHEAGRNKRTVWEIATQPYPEAHFATYPEELVIPCIKAGSREGDLVLDPFAGSGTTLAVARRLGRRAVGIELNPGYLPLIETRVNEAALPLLEALTSWGPAQPTVEAAAAANAGEGESSPAPRREVSA